MEYSYNRDAGPAYPAYILEVQYYQSDTVYANIMSKIGRFLEHGEPDQTASGEQRPSRTVQTGYAASKIRELPKWWRRKAIQQF